MRKIIAPLTIAGLIGLVAVAAYALDYGTVLATAPLTVTSTSNPLTLTINGLASGASVTTGATMTIAVSNIPSPHTADFIGVCPAGVSQTHANCDALYDWDYLYNCQKSPQPSSTSSSATCNNLIAPSTAGNYVVGFFPNNTYPASVTASFTATGGVVGGSGCQDADSAAGIVPSGWLCNSARSVDFDKLPAGGVSVINGTDKVNLVGGNSNLGSCGANTWLLSLDDAHNFVDSLGAHITTTQSGTTITTGNRIESTTNGYDQNETTLHLPTNFYYEYAWSANNGGDYVAFWTWGWDDADSAFGQASPVGTELDDNEGAGVNWFLHPTGTIYPNAYDAETFGHYYGAGWDGNFHKIGRLRNNGNYTMYWEQSGHAPGPYQAQYSFSASAMPNISDGTWTTGGPTRSRLPFTSDRQWYIWQSDWGGGCPNQIPHDTIIKYFHVYTPGGT